MAKKQSSLEAAFEQAAKMCWLKIEEREYEFAKPERKWRFDFSWVDALVAVELEGGVYSGGRHTRGAAFVADCDKYNHAAALGWTVLRYTASHLKSQPVQVIEQVRQVIADKKNYRAYWSQANGIQRHH